MPGSKVGPIVGVILAGGRAERMGGGDKGLREIGGKTIPVRVIERVRPQVDALVLNANGDPARFAAFGLPVVARSPACWLASTGPPPIIRRRTTSSRCRRMDRLCRAIWCGISRMRWRPRMRNW